jgi:hypothetical protein
MRLMLDVASPTLSPAQGPGAPARALVPSAYDERGPRALEQGLADRCAAFDGVHILHMAAGPSDGIVKQFANTFS